MTRSSTTIKSADVVRLMVVDDHPIVVEGYRQLLNLQADLEVRAVASSAIEALRKAKLTTPDLAIVDLVLKDSNGLDLVKDLHLRFPAMKLLVVSAKEESIYSERALHAGASGFVSKETATTKLVLAIRHVLAGEIYLSEKSTARLLNRVTGSKTDLTRSPVADLADREMEVFELIGRGHTAREIAGRLHVSRKTVDRHRENVKHKLSLGNATELTHYATLWVNEH